MVTLVNKLAACALLLLPLTVAAGEVLTLKGHNGWVGGVAFFPDGKTLVTGSADHTAKSWSLDTGKAKILKGHTDAVAAVAVSRDGRFVATASYDGTARVWNPDTGETRQVLKGHRGAVLAVAFSLDSLTLATGGMDGDIRLWSRSTAGRSQYCRATNRGSTPWHSLPIRKRLHRPVRTTRCIGMLPNANRKQRSGRTPANCGSVAFSPDGKYLAAGTRYGKVQTGMRSA